MLFLKANWWKVRRLGVEQCELSLVILHAYEEYDLMFSLYYIRYEIQELVIEAYRKRTINRE